MALAPSVPTCQIFHFGGPFGTARQCFPLAKTEVLDTFALTEAPKMTPSVEVTALFSIGPAFLDSFSMVVIARYYYYAHDLAI